MKTFSPTLTELLFVAEGFDEGRINCGISWHDFMGVSEIWGPKADPKSHTTVSQPTTTRT